MPTIYLTHPDGRRTTLDAKPGKSLMLAALDARISEILADCGGSLTCATCHVYVADAWLAKLPARSDDEDAMLDMTAAERRPNSRLSCQIKLDTSMEGLEVELPAQQH